MPDDKLITTNDIPCCAEITKEPCCQSLKFKYRLVNRISDIPVEVIITAELERCPGPLALGDLVYSTTLLPGEKVRLFTSNRNSRFTYDAESEVSYRHEQTSEESYYMNSMDYFMTDLSVTDQASGGTQSSGSFNTEGSTSGLLGTIFNGPSAEVNGNFSGESSFDFMRELSSHASASHDRSINATRTANAVQMGEVQSRTHAEGESESAYEASSRLIENRNDCHSVTYFAYQLVKRQTVRFRILSVVRKVIDAAADTRVDNVSVRPTSNVSVIPQGILATSEKRLDVESQARSSAVADRAGLVGNIGDLKSSSFRGSSAASAVINRSAALRTVKPLDPATRAKALQAVDGDLVKAGVLDKVGGRVSEKLRAELEFEVTTCLPTPAVIVKGCIDDCNVCEDTRQDAIKLDNQRKTLENDLLAKRIELLEKSQEYRCCPSDSHEHEEAVSP